MTPPKLKVHSLAEADILQNKHEDLDKAFVELYDIYVDDIYRFCFSLLYYHVHLAENNTRYVFEKAYKFFHAFIPGQVSYRSYLYSLAAAQILRDRKQLQSQSHHFPDPLRKKFTESSQYLWQALQHLDPTTHIILVLWYGPKLSVNEIAVVVNLDIYEVNRLHNEVVERFRTTISNFPQAMAELHEERTKYVYLTSTKRTRLSREIVEGRRRAPSFFKRAWWQALLGPMPMSFVLGVIAVVVAAVWYVNAPAPLVIEPETPSLMRLEPAAEQRPQAILRSGALPDIQLQKRSLTEIQGTVFGTAYPTVTTSGDDADELKPKFKINLPVNDYRPITEAFTYSTPTALTEDQLQLAAFNHFISLPLNQFTYVNGTYYIEDSTEEFRPLFVAFNNDGSVEFQMRQAAICQLEGLTNNYTDDDTRTKAYEFLRSHNFVEVEESELKIIRTSEDGRSIKKDAICKDGNTDNVQDREFVFFPGHTTVRYGDATDDVLPMRLRGALVQVHGQEVTSMRIDPLHMLRAHMVRTAQVDVMSLEDAVAEVKKFYYPAAADRDQNQRYTRVFAQWDHQHGADRLQEITLTDVALEYVFDPLNHRIEPYYVFFGSGVASQGADGDIRLYVAASTEEIELRAPYRE